MITPGEAKGSIHWLFQNTIKDSKEDVKELLIFFRVLSNRFPIDKDKLDYLLEIYTLPKTSQEDLFVLESYKKFIAKYPDEKEDYLVFLSKLLNYINSSKEENNLVLEMFQKEQPSLKYEQEQMNQVIDSKLANLIGLTNIKLEIRNLQNLALINKKRASKGLKSNTIAMHMVFSGSPGTGKTTVARIIGEIYYSLGIIEKSEVLEVAREDLVAEYLGQSEIKTKKVLERARGGVLFIDEAYSLSDTEDDYGKSVINTLLKFMEDHRDDTLIIIAGYTDEMAHFIKSNPGLESRFNTVLEFPNYTTEELMEILKIQIKTNDYQMSLEELEKVRKKIANVEKTEKTFANGRFVRNLFEKAIKKQATRLMDTLNPTKQDLMTLLSTDFLD